MIHGVFRNGMDSWLVVTGTWLDYDFPFSWEWNVIIPTDEKSIIFFRGVGVNHQPDIVTLGDISTSITI